MATKIVGNNSAHETWESGHRSLTSDALTLEYVLTGPYAALQAMMPAHGGKFRGSPVKSATLAPKKGGMGRLSVTVGLWSAGSSGGGDDGGGAAEPGVLNSVLEIEMAQAEIDVRQLIAGNDAAMRALAAWDRAPAALRAALKYEDPDTGAPAALSGPAKSVAQLILSGIESALRFHPVVTRTSYYGSDPGTKTVSGLGRVGGQPSGSPAGYEYLKTGDHWSQSRDASWMRVEQWTGAKSWNGSLYRGGSGRPIDISLLGAAP